MKRPGKMKIVTQAIPIIYTLVASALLPLASMAADLATIDGWSSDFEASKNEAISKNKPMILVWGNKGCTHCQKLEEDLQTNAEFKAWKAQTKYVYCFILGKNDKDPDGTENAKNFAKFAGGTLEENKSGYPFICFYWQKKDGTIVATSITDKGKKEKASIIIQTANSLFSSYVEKPEYTGGDLAFTANYHSARLEAEVGFTEFVDVPLVRDPEAYGWKGTNQIVVAYSGQEPSNETVYWSVDETNRVWRVEIPEGMKSGDTINVTLKNDDGDEERGTTTITLIDPKENSPKNPLFLGERTADTLQYGEWTMDLDVALEKYKAEADSKLLVLVGGSLWCPDCVLTDHFLLERAEFKDWATANKVICVDIDIPNNPNIPTGSSCLLTRLVSRASDNYVTGRGMLAADENERYQSGAGYLSRHMVADEDAQKVYNRNKKLVGTNWTAGGWNDPDRTNQNRTGVPVFLTLNRDGNIAGFLGTFSDTAPREFKASYLARLDELVALGASDGANLVDGSWQTTKATYNGTEALEGGVFTALDLKATYRLATSSTVAQTQTVTVSGEDDITVTVNLISVVDGVAKTTGTATGKLNEGVSVSGIISNTGDYYIQVVANATGALAIDTEEKPEVAYTIEGTREVIENPFTNEWITKALTTTLPLYSEDGKSLQGTLALTLKKNKSVSAKYSDGKKNLATFSGKWDASRIDVLGDISLELKKGNYVLALSLDAEGVIKATLTQGKTILDSGECGLAEKFEEFGGYYIVGLPSSELDEATALPTGASFMTLTMTSSSAKKKGTFKYIIYLANGKTLSGNTNVTWYDANFGILPILKTSSDNTFSALLKIRKNAPNAPSERAVIAMDGVQAVWKNTKSGLSFERKLAVFGSYLDKSKSLVERRGEATILFQPYDYMYPGSEKYGSITNIIGSGVTLDMTDTKIASAQNIKNFKISYNKSTGVFSGSTKLCFNDAKSPVKATYKGIILPGWFSDCDCGEDEDSLIQIQSLEFGIGFCVFSDKVNNKSIKTSFEIAIDKPALIE